MASRTKLVVGAAGQDGKLLTQDLISRGFPVVGVGRKDVTIFSSDGATEGMFARPANLVPLLQQINPDQIYYLAANHRSAQNSPTTEYSGETFQELFIDNVKPYGDFLCSIEKSGLDPRIFFAGSSLVFEGNPDASLDESSAMLPYGYYGMAKAQGIWLGRKFREERGLRISSGILFNHESHLRSRDFFTARVILGAIRISEGVSRSLSLGSLDGLVDWGSAKDFVSGFQKILALEQPGDFIVATGSKNSPRLFVELAFRFFNLDWEDYVIENPNAFPRRNDIGDADSSKIRRLTGWEPSCTFPELVAQLCENRLEYHRRSMRATSEC